MKTITQPFAQLSNAELLDEVRRLAAAERQVTARLIASLMELDARRLHLGEGCSSLFTYCTRVLHLSEHAAYGRIEAARAARRFPSILELLSDGAITLTTVGLLARHLTAENHAPLLNAARYKTKREVEQLVAVINPRPDVLSSIRKLPVPKPLAVPAAAVGEREGIGTELARPVNARPCPVPPVHSPSRPAATVVPLAPERYKVQFTVSRETYDKLRRAQDLLRHSSCVRRCRLAAMSCQRPARSVLAPLRRPRPTTTRVTHVAFFHRPNHVTE